MNPSEFLKMLWGPDPPGIAHVFSAQPVYVRWYRNFDTVTKDLAPLTKQNHYTGMGLVPKGYPTAKDKRFTLTTQAAAIGCLWADVDVLDPESHKETRLPPTQQDALTLLQELPQAPTVAINTGHGIQAFWMFKTPWTFGSWEDQQEAAAMEHWWIQLLKQKAAEKEWTVDPVFDLTRPMRLPGLPNVKIPESPVMAEAIYNDGPRMDPNDYINEARSHAAQPGPGATIRRPNRPNDPRGNQEAYTFTLTREATAPEDKLQAALLDTTFKMTWERQRNDFQGTTASHYDMSLANQTVRMGWTDQEIVDALIEGRRQSGNDLKLRYDYYWITLFNARAMERKENAEKALSDMADSLQDGENIGETEVLTAIGNATGLEIIELVRYRSEPETHWIATARGDASIGKIESLASENRFLERTDRLVPATPRRPRTQKGWDALAAAFAAIAVTDPVKEDPTDTTEAAEVIAEYLSSSETETAPLVPRTTKQGRTAINGGHLARWLKAKGLPANQAESLMTALQATKARLRTEDPEAGSGFWHLLPEDLTLEHDD